MVLSVALEAEEIFFMPRRYRKIFLAVLATLAAAFPALTADYPTKPVQIINQSAAGSGPDVIGRILAEQLTQRLGQQVLIIDHPGAGGLVAAQAAAAAQADGYMLYMPASSALMVLPQTHPHLPFDFHRDFVPIGMIATQPLLITAAPALGVSTLPELIALAKKEPGKILYAGNTPGTIPALTGEMLKQRAGIDITFVSYPGVTAALTDLGGGRISVVIESMSALAGAIQGGTVKLLAVASDKRLPQFPDVPTVAKPCRDSWRLVGLLCWRALVRLNRSCNSSTACCAHLSPTPAYRKSSSTSARSPRRCCQKKCRRSLRVRKRIGFRWIRRPTSRCNELAAAPKPYSAAHQSWSCE